MEEKHIACREEVDACLVCSLEDVIFHVSLCFFFFLTMVSNGIDTMGLPCSALNVKVVSVSPCLFCSPVLSCAVPRRARACARARARASACLVHHCDFSSVCSCVLPCLLWLVCLLFEEFDLPQWYHVFLLLVAAASTFRDFKLHPFHMSSRARSLKKFLQQLREAKNMIPLWKVKFFENQTSWKESVLDRFFWENVQKE